MHRGLYRIENHWITPVHRGYPDAQRRQRGDQFAQLVARDRRTQQRSATGFVDTLDGKNVLGEIDAYGNCGHYLPLFESIDEPSHFPSWLHRAAYLSNELKLVRLWQ